MAYLAVSNLHAVAIKYTGGTDNVEQTFKILDKLITKQSEARYLSALTNLKYLKSVVKIFAIESREMHIFYMSYSDVDVLRKLLKDKDSDVLSQLFNIKELQEKDTKVIDKQLREAWEYIRGAPDVVQQVEEFHERVAFMDLSTTAHQLYMQNYSKLKVSHTRFNRRFTSNFYTEMLNY